MKKETSESSEESYASQLCRLLESIKNWDTLAYWDKVRAIEDFMDKIAVLFLDYFQTHQEVTLPPTYIHL